jgi:hypothetical protein
MVHEAFELNCYLKPCILLLVHFTTMSVSLNYIASIGRIEKKKKGKVVVVLNSLSTTP